MNAKKKKRKKKNERKKKKIEEPGQGNVSHGLWDKYLR